MSTWRPKPFIRVIALGLHWRNGRLLAEEVCEDDGRIKGVRPLGGGVEFGESWAEAIVREFREELGIDVALSGTHAVLENIYSHEGTSGHEVAFICPITFPDDAFTGQDHIIFHEDDGGACVARWYDLADLDLEGGPKLYPAGLKDFLLKSEGP